MDYFTKKARLIQTIQKGSCDGDCLDCPYYASDDCESEYLAENLLSMESEMTIEFHEKQKRFTPEEVKSMTSKELFENYQAIMDSMKEW